MDWRSRSRWICICAGSARSPRTRSGPPVFQGLDGDFTTQGVQGLQGSQGFASSQGPQGTFSIQGTQGIQGSDGPSGKGGNRGSFGTFSAQGIIGREGLQGPEGFIQGFPGNASSQGCLTDYRELMVR